MRLTFLGAAGTVTGSRHLVEYKEKAFLVDCGLFQGKKENRLKNWDAFPFDPEKLDSIFLTHAHIDHIGFLPRVVKDGFTGPIYGSQATVDLAKILLPDTGHLMEEEAKFANKKGFTKHHPAKPLFTEEDAREVFQFLSPIAFGDHIRPAPDLRVKYRDTGHILGAGFIDFKVTRGGQSRKLVFSGDLGRPLDSILRSPATPYNVDYLVLESTYGDRLHESPLPTDELARIINESMARKGVVVIPAFAVGRTQSILYAIRELEESGKIPPVPVFVDSPMAIEALKVHQSHLPDLNLSCRVKWLSGTKVFQPKFLRLSVSRKESMAINNIESGAIIISASGMATGGRIVHHLRQRLPEKQNTILFIGYQAEGTRGRTIMNGNDTVRIFGEDVPVEAKVESIPGFSGHADYNEMLAWMMGFNKAPERVFLVHGEPETSQAFAAKIKKQFNWDVTVPEEGDSVVLNM